MTTVAATILEQLGGSRFIAMTGAKDFVGSSESLMFRLPAGAKGRINKVYITLEPYDTYTLGCFNVRGASVTTVAIESMLYANQLQTAFTRMTGLDTHL